MPGFDRLTVAGAARYGADYYDVVGTSAASNSCRSRELPLPGTVIAPRMIWYVALQAFCLIRATQARQEATKDLKNKLKRYKKGQLRQPYRNIIINRRMNDNLIDEIEWSLRTRNKHAVESARIFCQQI